MFNTDHWQEIFHTIKQNKLRTFLTAFSVSWGIFMLVFLLGFGSGFEKGVLHNFQDNASNSLRIYPGQISRPYKGNNPGKRIVFTDQDIEAIKQNIPTEHISGWVNVCCDYYATYGKEKGFYDLVGIHPGFMYYENTEITQGRFINDRDLEEKRKTAVISKMVQEELFGDESPIGKWVQVKKMPYKVVGIFDDSGGQNELEKIYIPITTAQQTYLDKNTTDRIIMTVDAPDLAKAKRIEESIRSLLGGIHMFEPSDPRAVFVRGTFQEYEKIQSLFQGIRSFLWAIGIGTIIAGIVGVSNIMLIVANERIREIGVRKALGATSRSIITLFMLESLTITFIAGYMGLIGGMAVVEGVNMLMEQAIGSSDGRMSFFRNPEVHIQTAILATVLMIVAGLLAGFFPARRASSIQPIEALREE